MFFKLLTESLFSIRCLRQQLTQKGKELIWQILSNRFNHRGQMDNDLHT